MICASRLIPYVSRFLQEGSYDVSCPQPQESLVSQQPRGLFDGRFPDGGVYIVPQPKVEGKIRDSVYLVVSLSHHSPPIQQRLAPGPRLPNLQGSSTDVTQ